MRRHSKTPRLGLAALGLFALMSCATMGQGAPGLASPPREEPQWIPLGPGIFHATLVSSKPRVEAHALRIELTTPGLEVVVSPSQEGRASSQYVTSFARAYGCLAAVNTLPFDLSSATEGEARGLVGLSVAGGRIQSSPVPPMAVLVLRKGAEGLSGEIRLQEEGHPSPGEAATMAAAAGGFSLVLDAQGPRGGSRSREPRTAAGLSADGRILYLLVADGRRAASAGLTNHETGLWLSWLGAARAMTFDGGGSTAMALRGANGVVQLANVPIHGGIPGRERAVGACLGFRLVP